MTRAAPQKPKKLLKIPRSDFDEMHGWLNSLFRGIQTVRVIESVSEWMERKMILTEGQSVYPGRFDFGLTPYLREIADNLSVRSGVIETAVIKGNQLGFSTISFGYMGYCIDYGIGPVLFVSGDQQMAEDTMEKRVDAVIEAAGLADKIKPVVKKKHDKSTGDRKDMKSYGGTFLRAAGPNSESKLRTFPSRVNLIEELDVFPQTLKGKGNPVEKIERRADSFGPLRRLYKNSTPKEKITSQIEPAYNAGDCRLYHVPCKKCGHLQPLTWGGLKWDKKDDGTIDIEIDEDGLVTKDPVYYECAACGAHWKNSDKFYFLRDAKAGGMTTERGEYVAAEWRPTKKPDRPGIRSYKLPSFYSPFRSWLDIVLQFLRVKDDPILFPDFVNDVLAETSETAVKTPEAHWLMARAEDWWHPGDPPPKEVLFITLAADIQADRIEAGIVGWGKDRENWVLDYWVFPGTTEDPASACWRELEEKIAREYVRIDGTVIGRPIVSMIDAGYLQDQVNYFCAQFVYSPKAVDGVYPVVGKENLRNVWAEYANDIGTPMIHLHDQRLKRTLYSYLMREPPVRGAAIPIGYTHFPQGFSEDWYKQLTAEEMHLKVDAKGRKTYVIENVHQRRNEVLDVIKMNWGAVYFAYYKYFEIRNKALKTQGRTQIEPDWSVFWRMWEEEES